MPYPQGKRLKEGRRMATIYEIAREVGVSPSTVARALRGTGYCSRENSEKILAAARQLNYVPSQAARALKSKRTRKILFVIPDIYNPFYFGMIKGASDVLDQHGYYSILCHSRGDKKIEKRLLRTLQEGYGDGMIFVSFDFNKDIIAEVNACGLPVVLTNNYQSLKGEDRFDCVYIDTFEGIWMSCRHFIDSGYTKIGYIGGDTSVQTGRERFAGFIKAMNEGNVPVNQKWLKEGDFSRESGEKSMEELIRAGTVPDALVVANDLMAVGALQTCRRAGLSIPGDIAIVGMDNTALSTCTSPELSSIAMKEEDIGRHAATLLMQRILEGRTEKRTIRLQPELVLRDSSRRGPV
jgi:LacI family transcriptional regulator